MSNAAALREQQTQLTRDLILHALTDLIVEQGLEDLSIQKVAQHAGVSHRTVYRHYPSRQALLDGLAEWLTKTFEQRLGRPETAMFDDPIRSVRQSFATMGELDRHMQAYVILTTGTRMSAALRKSRTDKIRRWLEQGPAQHLPRKEAKAVSALVRLMVSSSAWFQLTTELGLDAVTAGDVTSWALDTLVGELERGGGPVLGEEVEK